MEAATTTLERRVREIPPTRKPEELLRNYDGKMRVAAYCRVSTDSEEQLNSYEAQKTYYTQKIQDNPDWEMAGIYADEGISGTSLKKRAEFNKMITACKRGRIDFIITKSLSRFARNTVDCLDTVRLLKANGIGVYFEKENINTLTESSEFLVTLFSGFAQAESESLSKNVAWGKEKSAKAGNVHFQYKKMLGYRKGEDGQPEIVPEEAAIVRRIYRRYLDGCTLGKIKRELDEDGVPTAQGVECWSPAIIHNILTNEKYKGDALMQKCYTMDFLTKKQVVNRGVLPQYYVEDDHEAIIDPETFDLVQQEMIRRRKTGSRYSGVDIFASRLVCGECGSYYGAKVWHSNSKYRRVIYQCNHKYHEGNSCNTPHLTENEIKQGFVVALNRLLEGKATVISNLESLSLVLFDTLEMETTAVKLKAEMELVQEMIQKAIAENARVALDQKEYKARFDELSQRFDALEKQRNELERQIADRVSRRAATHQFIGVLKKQKDLITEFDPSLWGALLDHATIYGKDDIRFTFKDGTEINAIG